MNQPEEHVSEPVGGPQSEAQYEAQPEPQSKPQPEPVVEAQPGVAQLKSVADEALRNVGEVLQNLPRPDAVLSGTTSSLKKMAYAAAGVLSSLDDAVSPYLDSISTLLPPTPEWQVNFAGAGDWFQLMAQMQERQPAGGNALLVARQVGPLGEEQYVLVLPGTTQSLADALKGERDGRGFTWSENVEGFLRPGSAAHNMALQALADAGIPPGAHLAIIGFSQGGLVAQTIAATLVEQFTLDFIVMAGMRGSAHAVPQQVPILAVNQDEDPVSGFMRMTDAQNNVFDVVLPGQSADGAWFSHHVTGYASGTKSWNDGPPPQVRSFICQPRVERYLGRPGVARAYSYVRDRKPARSS